MSLIKSKPGFSTSGLFTDFFNDGFLDDELMTLPWIRSGAQCQRSANG